ncbi:MAG: 4Fe-4S dicluster domain-containing protein [Candidatus Omnitrophica bacterium]|nr:4Fe-4S dicluster domain-containing protein [Candidatus Omnitrophota bacterium]
METLLILGGNPVYSAPADLDWERTQRHAKTVVRLGYHEDETFALCDWHLPAAHYLESWGDARTGDGTLVAIQPLIEPLFGGQTELEVLARVAGLSPTEPLEIVRETFRGLGLPGGFEANWKRFLHDGFLANSAARTVAMPLDWPGAVKGLAAEQVPLPDGKQLEVVFHRDYGLDDGRHNNNGWLQELPNPITALTWDNAVLISRRTAAELGVKNYDLVDIQFGNRSVRGPVWIQPCLADYSLGLALGFGRTRTGRVGEGAGFNAYRLRTAGAEQFAVGAILRATGSTYSLSCTQNHWSMEGRSIVREANLSQYRAQPHFAKAMDREAPPSERSLYPNPLDELRKRNLEKRGITQQWGMSIDLNACVGCGACVIACQSENNIPIVGKEQVKNNREMHWLRVDRYYAAGPALEASHNDMATDDSQALEKWIDDPQVVHQVMICQHCEAAPCENVCPVNATVHDDEGLNVMVYNRCVGTRYCSNNCPYKVRRFNFFDYNKRPIEGHRLYLGPLAKKQALELELLKLSKNPDVTVRMRGVMEKCTYCLQRIEQAKIAQKIKAGASGDVAVRDGAIQTACQQVCPAEAIVFGDVADPNSRVSRLKAMERNYSVLEFLRTKPRTTYLARVRNPNPRMPDYYAMPFSEAEYWRGYEVTEGKLPSAGGSAREPEETGGGK